MIIELLRFLSYLTVTEIFKTVLIFLYAYKKTRAMLRTDRS